MAVRVSFVVDLASAEEIAEAIAALYKLMPSPSQGQAVAFTVGPGQGPRITVAGEPGVQLSLGKEQAPVKDIVWARQQLRPFLDDPLGKKVAGEVLRGAKYGVTELDKVEDFEAFVKDVDAAFKAAKAQQS